MTAKQKQCLLCYLGLYSGPIDGIWGEKSRQAQGAFEGKFGPFTPENLLAALSNTVDFWQEIPNFTREEFRCKCGGKFCGGFPAEPAEKLVRLAQAVRSHFDAPAVVSSGVRCQTHNANVGGVPGSRHKLGTAMDFCVRGKTSGEVLDFVLARPETHYAYAIDGNYIHMDVIVP